MSAPSPPEARPRFVRGIGPPLSQLQQDYVADDGLPAADVHALIDEVLRLDAELRELQEALAELDREGLLPIQMQLLLAASSEETG